MRERTGRTIRAPLGAGVAAVSPPAGLGLRDTQHRIYGSQAVRHFFWSNPGLTNVFCESRDTKHGFLSRNVARMVHVGTEALQSCFFCPGMLGNSSRRRRGTVPCGSRIRASQVFTDRNPLILRSLRDTNHETRVTAFMFFTNHESRNTRHESRLCVFHESRVTKHGLYGARWY